MAQLVPQPGPLPLGPPSALAQPFWEGAAAGELRYPRCSVCGKADFPAAPNCRFCLSAALVWEVSAGLGTVYSYTVVWRPVTPDFVTPYAPAIVELDEGYSIMTNLVGLDSDDLAVGLRVTVGFEVVTDGPTLPYFRPA
jgi:uncharacterized OB-fold protein